MQIITDRIIIKIMLSKAISYLFGDIITFLFPTKEDLETVILPKSVSENDSVKCSAYKFGNSTKINACGYFRLIITQNAKENSISIIDTIDSDLKNQNEIKVYLFDNELHIESVKISENKKLPIVQINLTKLSKLKLNGAVTCSIKNINSNSLKVICKGLSSIDAQGLILSLKVFTFDGSFADFRSVVCASIEIQCSGLSQVKLSNPYQIDADLRDGSTLYHSGHPLINGKIKGFAKVRTI